jgi:hypothetical protein
MPRPTRRDIAKLSREIEMHELIVKGELPYTKAKGCNHSETAFLELAKTKGMRVLRGGWPDFLVEGVDGRTVGVEIKHSSSGVSAAQREMFAALVAAGVPVYVWRPGTGALVPWARDAAGAPITARRGNDNTKRRE